MAEMRKGWKGKRIGLALGGGGARGLAHIGALKVFQKEGIPIHLLAGTSIGALVGGAYASGTGPEELEEKVCQWINSPEFQSSAIQAIEAAHRREETGLVHKVECFLKDRFYVVQAMLRPGILPKQEFQAVIDHFIPDVDIEETQITFRAAATDLVSGELVTFATGSLRQAVYASCAVPGTIEPLKQGELLLADGGIICLVPISIAKKEGADIVFAVRVERDACSEEEFRTGADVYMRASEIMARQMGNLELMDADVVISPNVGNLHWSEFSQATSLVDKGEQAAMDKLDAIRSVIPGKKKWFTLNQILKSLRDMED